MTRARSRKASGRAPRAAFPTRALRLRACGQTRVGLWCWASRNSRRPSSVWRANSSRSQRRLRLEALMPVPHSHRTPLRPIQAHTPLEGQKKHTAGELLDVTGEAHPGSEGSEGPSR